MENPETPATEDTERRQKHLTVKIKKMSNTNPSKNRE